MTLPPESELPGLRKPPIPPPDLQQSSEPEQREPQETDPRDSAKLPSEATLPVNFQVQKEAVATDDDRQQQDLLRLRQSEDHRPWLRIQSQSHLDRIRSLAFSHDSQRLYASGDDKHVLVYQRTDDAGFVHERTIRWQIQRGPRGRIYSTATAPGLLAIGGFGAMGGLGEILVLGAERAELLQALVDDRIGHRQRLTSLSFSSSDPPSLASMDQHGKLLVWMRDTKSGIWSARQLAYEPQQEIELQTDRRLHPIAMVSPHQVVAPAFAGKGDDGQSQWQLVRYDVRGEPVRLSPEGEFHRGMVTAMAADRSGRRLASADTRGRLILWSIGEDVSQTAHQLDGVVSSLSFRGDGRVLAVGTAFGGRRRVMLWDTTDVTQAKPSRNREVKLNVLACAISPDGTLMAYSQGNDVVIQPASDEDSTTTELRSNTAMPTRVGFSRSGPYRIAFSTKEGDHPEMETVFEPRRGQLDNSPIREKRMVRARRRLGRMATGVQRRTLGVVGSTRRVNTSADSSSNY